MLNGRSPFDRSCLNGPVGIGLESRRPTEGVRDKANSLKNWEQNVRIRYISQTVRVTSKSINCIHFLPKCTSFVSKNCSPFDPITYRRWTWRTQMHHAWNSTRIDIYRSNTSMPTTSTDHIHLTLLCMKWRIEVKCIFPMFFGLSWYGLHSETVWGTSENRHRNH